ncbi:hypothetical protein KP77_28680 [Jeotgalibacillus alimentarius]|uniref:SLH domain-containing protein n=1 Tax=Jeotgalibacillus alimentarius TaxID=135826 RepID=A0A0C2V6Q6_9BACL|nr:S-layer homology domain-containing protein [Jeotgalibacillus alimentarius]KIL44647.1 hypothetical protein KP77_28680 [Jeotgalibacillus alimentarius]
MAYQPKSYRKFLAGTVTTALVASAVAPVAGAETTQNEAAQESGYTDVPATNSHFENIYKAEIAGLMGGYPDGTFKPLQDLTRSNVVKALGKYVVAAAGFETVAEYFEANEEALAATEAFNDVPSDSVDSELYNYSLIVKEAGIFQGSNNNLMPLDNITRQQMAQVIVNAFNLDEVETDNEVVVEDLDSAFTQYQDDIQILANHEVTTVSNFRPLDYTSRGHLASFLVQAYEVVYGEIVDGEYPGVTSVEFNEEGNMFTVEFDEDISEDVTTEWILENYDVEVNDTPVTELDEAVVEALNLDIDSVDGMTVTFSHTDLDDLREALEGDEVTLSINGVEDTYVFAGEVAVTSVSAINAKSVAVTFNTDVSDKDLKAEDFKVSNLAVTNVSVNGKVATLTLSSELSNGTTYTVDFEKEGYEKSSANFLYAVEVEKGIKLEKTAFTIYANQADENIFDFVKVYDVNGKEVPESQIASKDIETDNTNVVDATNTVTKGDIKGTGTAKVNIRYTLTDGTVLETGSTTISAVAQDAKNTAGFSINTAADQFENTVDFKLAQADNEHKTVLYPTQGTAAPTFLSVYAYDANNDPLTEAVTSSNSEVVEYNVTTGGTLLQVNKNDGSIIYQASTAGKATVNVKKGAFSYNAEVELRNAAELKDITANKSALQVAETNTANATVIDPALQSASMNLTFLDQYATEFGADFTNEENGVANFTVSAPTAYANDNGDTIGQQANVTFTSHDGSTKSGRVVITADHTKLTVGFDEATNEVTVTSTNRDISVDENVNLTVALYDTNTATPKVIKTITVPVKVKDITEVTAQKLFKGSDMNPSGLNKTSKIELWEVDKDGDKIRKVEQGVETVNRGADLTVGTADDVTLSSNDVIEFEAVVPNNKIADAFIKEATATTASPSTPDGDNKLTLTTTGDAEATYEFVPTADLLYGEDVIFTVKAKTGDASNANLLVAQTVDVRAYNSKSVANTATVKTTNTIDISETNKVIGGAATAPISIKDSLLGLYDVSEYIVDSIGAGPTDTVIALKNGQDGVVVKPVVELKDQNGDVIKLGPVSYGEPTANFAAGAQAINDRILSTLQGYSADQDLEFEATLLDTKDVTFAPAIGAPLTGAETVALAADKEQGTVKVLLTAVYRSGDLAAPAKKNLLPASQIVTLTYTR